MKTRIIVLAAVALVALPLLAAACGGDGDGGEEAAIRTQRGLGVAALAAGAQAGEETTDSGRDTGTAPGAPASDVGTGSGGAASPDFAPFPFPAAQESQSGITVQGYGSASLDADSALLEFYFSGGATGEPVPQRDETEPGASGGGAAPGAPDVQTQDQAQPITEEDLQPVVDAIAAQGVSRGDIEVIVEPFFGDPYYGGSATIRVTARSVDAVDGIVAAATEAASGLEGISFNGSNVSYTVSDCAALELAAMEAAVEDARERGQSFASALGVGLGAVEGASHYSYSPFGGTPCDSGFGGPYPLGGVAYAEGQATEVQLIATVTITFAIR